MRLRLHMKEKMTFSNPKMILVCHRDARWPVEVVRVVSVNVLVHGNPVQRHHDM
jgi:hypothetical protein